MTAIYLLVAVFLLIANGFFVAAEFAVIAARRAQLEGLAAEGDPRAKIALKSASELSFMLSAAQLGITMASLGLGFVGEPALAHLIESGLGFGGIPETALHSISFVLALGIVTFLHMVLSEMAPKNIAIADPEKTALWIAVPFRFYANLFRPFIAVFNAIANAGTRLLGVEVAEERADTHTAPEIRALVQESAKEGLILEFENRLLSGAIGFGERDAASVMIPRTEVTAIPATAAVADIEQVVVRTGHSRLPVYGRDLDSVLGFFHSKDLLNVPAENRHGPLPRRFIRRMVVAPESRKLHPLLFEMRRQRKHFALVVDEHGGTAGIVTLEDLLEELVGEIQDEHDASEVGVEQLSDDRYLVPGNLRIDEAADYLGIRLPEGEYETVAGWLMDRLGRIPRRRDVVEHEGRSFRVRSMARRRVAQVLIEPSDTPAEARRVPDG